MNLKTLFKIAVGTAVLGFGTAANAVVYCPGNSAYTDVGDGYMSTTTTTTPPVAGTNTPAGWGSYISSNQFTNGRNCYWVDGNLDNSDKWDEFDAASTQFNFSSFTLKDVFGDNSDNTSALVVTYAAGAGTFAISGFNLSQPLYIGFHFGNGQDSPDSFIVQLSSLSGSFNFVNDEGGKGAGLSNIYLFGTRCTNGDCEIPPPVLPEPGTLALLGAGLAGLAIIRRRRRV